MAKNNKVKKEVKSFNLRLAPEVYDEIQLRADKEVISMNKKLQLIIDDHLLNKK